MIRAVFRRAVAFLLATSMLTPAIAAAPAEMKQAAAANIDANAKLVQVMVDTVFSYGEPGFQEFKTGEYLTSILAKNGFKITKGVAGIPSAWTATWGEGGPLIALGSDEDDLRGVSQIPGSPKIEPLVEGAPGHGEGHNSGMPLIIAAAIAVKEQMIKNHIKGRLMLWPGIAEELLGSKAFYVRDGLFKGVDACIFTHVASEFGTFYGNGPMNGMVSVEYTFHGRTAHAAGDPWDGRSALDAVELMDVAMNFRREHLPLSQRTHYVVTDGGGQPNIVPGHASVWYYFREKDFASVKNLFDIGNRTADAAAMMTDTTVDHKIMGYAAPNFGNKPIAELAYANIQAVGMPKWSADDQAFAKLVQETQHFKLQPLKDKAAPITMMTPSGGMPTGGGSDDIGDIMWTVPTATIFFPSNIPNTIGHNVTSAMAMATPIAHKGAVAGAKAVAMTVLDLMTSPEELAKAKTYFDTDQQKFDHYAPLISATDVPAIHVNDDYMRTYRPLMEPYYFDSKKYDTYLDQLGIKYPNPPVNGIRKPAKSGGAPSNTGGG